MVMLNNCCGCCSLKTGTLVSGALGIATAILAFINLLVTKVKFKVILLDDISPLIAKIIISINLIILLVISILLIIGAVKRKRWFMLPWVVLDIIGCIGLAISVIYTTVVLFSQNEVTSATIILIFGLIILVIKVYLWLVVLSYYQLVRDEKNRGPYERPYYR